MSVKKKTPYEWAVEQYGDEADNMSQSEIESLYNQAMGNVSDDAISKQDFRNDEETNSNLYKLGGKFGPLMTAGRRKFENMQDETKKKMEQAGKTDTTSPQMAADTNSVTNALYDAGVLHTSSGLESHDSFTDLAEMRHKLTEAGVDTRGVDNKDIKALYEKTFSAGQSETGSEIKPEGGNPAIVTQDGEKLEPKDEESTEEETSESVAETIADTTGDDPDDVQDTVNEAVDETKKSKKGRYALKSIFQAYHDGDIDASTRDYMIIDTLSTFARNMGKDLANIAAAYTGGAVDNSREESLWSKKQNQLAQAGTEQDIREQDNAARSNDENDLDWKAKKLGLSTKELQNQALEISNSLNKLTKEQREDLGKEFDELIKKAPNETAKTKLLTLKSQATGAGGAQLDQTGVLTLAGTEIWDKFKEFAGIK